MINEYHVGLPERLIPNRLANKRMQRTGFALLRSPWLCQPLTPSLADTENKGDTQMTKVTPFLMFNDQLESAIAFYTATFPSSEITRFARTGTMSATRPAISK